MMDFEESLAAVVQMQSRGFTSYMKVPFSDLSDSSLNRVVWVFLIQKGIGQERWLGRYCYGHLK